MTALFNWRVWAALTLAITLAGTHWKAYRMGGAEARATLAEVQANHATEDANRSRAALKYVEATTAQVAQVEKNYAQAKSQAAAAGATADAALASLRDALAQAPNPGDSASAPAPSGANGAGGLERDLLGQCAIALVSLAKSADRLEAKVVGLQDYIKAIQAAK